MTRWLDALAMRSAAPAYVLIINIALLPVFLLINTDINMLIKYAGIKWGPIWRSFSLCCVVCALCYCSSYDGFPVLAWISRHNHQHGFLLLWRTYSHIIQLPYHLGANPTPSNSNLLIHDVRDDASSLAPSLAVYCEASLSSLLRFFFFFFALPDGANSLSQRILKCNVM